MKLKNQNGLSMVELLVVTAILTFMMGGVVLTMTAGQASWTNTDAQIELQDDLRLTLDKLTREIRESGDDAGGTLQLTITDGGSDPDTVTFSMPIVCEAGGSVIDSSGDVANWGAPLTWGCTSSTCMDADDDCSSRDYASVRYVIDGSNRLVRRVLNDANAVVREDIFAHNLSDLQATLSGDEKLVTITITMLINSDLNRQITASESMNIYLRNKG